MRYVAIVIGVVWSSLVLAADEQGKTVLATFDDQQITVSEFADKQPALMSWVGIGASEEPIEGALDGMIFSRLLALQGSESGLSEEPEVKAQIDSILANAYLKRQMSKNKPEISSAEIEKYYEDNLQKYKRQEFVKVSHLLVKSQAEAERIRQSLNTGASWSSAVAKYSIDPATAKFGGSLGFVPPVSLSPELRERIGGLAQNEISQPIATKFGYELLRIDELPTVSFQPIEEVTKDIYTDLQRQRQATAREEIKNELWSKYHVTINREAIHGLVQERSSIGAQVQKASFGPRQREPGQATQLQFISETMDLGRVPARKLSRSLLFVNAGQGELTVVRVGSTSPGIKVAVDKPTLAAGELGRLSIQFDPVFLKEQGVMKRTIYIESTDPIEPRKFINVNAEIVKG